MVDDKSVATEFGEKQSNENSTKQQQEHNSSKQGKKIVDENIYAELPEQPKRLAPSPPGDIKQRSQSVKSRRRAPAPPDLSRSTSGLLSHPEIYTVQCWI